MPNNFERTLRKLRLRHFELLVLLGSEATLRGAARKMSLTQPAVSKMLREIEAAFGGELFERSATGVIPNNLGIHLMQYVKVMVNEMRVVSDEIAAMAGGPASIIRVGSVSVIPRVPKAIAILRKDFPALQVMVKEAMMPLLIQLLIDGELDCIVGALPPEMLESKDASLLRVQTMAEDELCVMAAPTHPLVKRAAATKSLGWKDLVNCDWVLPPRVSLLRRAVVDAYLKAGLEPPEPVVELMSPLSVFDLLTLDRTLVGVMRREQAMSDPVGRKLRTLPIRPGARLPPISFITRRKGTRHPSYLEAFFQALSA